MKRFLSWVVLCVLSAIASVVLGVVYYLLWLLSNWIFSLPKIAEAVMRWLVYCFLGSIDFLAPVLLSICVISLCEKIHQSKKGIRYIVCGAYAIFCLVLRWIISREAPLSYIMFAVFGVTMIVWAVKNKHGK